jgi:hypothetical protein
MVNLSAKIPPTGPLVGLHLPTGFTDAVAFGPAKPAAKNSFEGLSPEICPRVLSALDGFDMAKTLTPS